MFNNISKKGKSFTFEQFLDYSKKNLKKMSEIELTAVFTSLNTD